MFRHALFASPMFYNHGFLATRDLGSFFNHWFYWFYWFLLRIGGVRALVLVSVKSGKSVDNKERVLSLAEQILQFVLSTDFTDFTDFWLRFGVVRARVSASVKSGKSEDNKKRVLSLAGTRSKGSRRWILSGSAMGLSSVLWILWAWQGVSSDYRHCSTDRRASPSGQTNPARCRDRSTPQAEARWWQVCQGR